MTPLDLSDLRKHTARTLLVAAALVVAVFWINRALSRRAARPAGRVSAVRVIDATGGPVLQVDLDQALANRDPKLPSLVGGLRTKSVVLVRIGDLGAIARLHPAVRDSMTLESALPPLPAGEYHVFADVISATGVSGLLVESVHVDGGMRRWHPTDPADAMYAGGGVGTPFRFEDGATLVWRGAGEERHVGVDAGLRFGLRDASGRPQPISDLAHTQAVLVRDNGGSYVQLDSMTFDAKTGDVQFPYVFPNAGRFRLWVQLPVRGRVRTAAFDLLVGAKAP